MIQSASSLRDGKATLEYVVMVILKQPTDGPLSKALTCVAIHTTSDILALSQPARDALTYQDDNGTVKPLAIGHKNRLRVLKMARWKVLPLSIGWRLLRRTLMTLGAVKQVCVLLRWTTPSLLLPYPSWHRRTLLLWYLSQHPRVHLLPYLSQLPRVLRHDF